MQILRSRKQSLKGQKEMESINIMVSGNIAILIKSVLIHFVFNRKYCFVGELPVSQGQKHMLGCKIYPILSLILIFNYYQSLIIRLWRYFSKHKQLIMLQQGSAVAQIQAVWLDWLGTGLGGVAQRGSRSLFAKVKGASSLGLPILQVHAGKLQSSANTGHTDQYWLDNFFFGLRICHLNIVLQQTAVW